jgi:hypothetical protein
VRPRDSGRSDIARQLPANAFCRPRTPIRVYVKASCCLIASSAHSRFAAKMLSSPRFGQLGDGSYYSLGNKVLNSSADTFFYSSDDGLTLLVNGLSSRSFTLSGSTYVAPTDSYLVLTDDTTHAEFILTDQTNNLRWVFYDFTSTNGVLQGFLKEQSTLQLYSQGKSGFVYSYNSDGTVDQITSPTGQDYNIAFTYVGGMITQVQVQDQSGNAIEHVGRLHGLCVDDVDESAD